jgi:N-acetylglucosaminyl-diphospho-decaprenol L-rhamnosyltransferase
VTRRSDAVAVVLVSHDTRDEVLGCLATLPTDVPTVVVDTGSTDGTAAAVRAVAPHVTVLELANAGFGRGANAGVRATDAEVVVVANADVRFAPGAPAALAREAEADVALVGPRVRYPDGRHQASARALPDPPTAILHALLRWPVPGNRWTARYREHDADPDLPRDVGWVSGCVAAVRRDAFDEVGGFDPGYPLYLEDVDLAARLHAAGWRVRYAPVTTVVHRVGASTGRRRWRALRWHARGLERYVVRRYGAVGRAVRLPLRGVLEAWVVVTYLAERTLGRDRSTTGE